MFFKLKYDVVVESCEMPAKESETVIFQPFLPELIPPLPPLLRRISGDIVRDCSDMADRMIKVIGLGVPIDLDVINRLLRVVKIEEWEDRSARVGLLEHYVNKRGVWYYRTWVSAKARPWEKRITMAHEAGHQVIRELCKEDGYAKSEEAADAFARAILAPEDYLRDHFEGKKGAMFLKTFQTVMAEIQMAPDFLMERLVKDLKLDGGLDLLVIVPCRDLKPEYGDGYIFSQKLEVKTMDHQDIRSFCGGLDSNGPFVKDDNVCDFNSRNFVCLALEEKDHPDIVSYHHLNGIVTNIFIEGGEPEFRVFGIDIGDQQALVNKGFRHLPEPRGSCVYLRNVGINFPCFKRVHF